MMTNPFRRLSPPSHADAEEREHMTYFFTVFRLDVGPGQAQGRSDDGGIIEPAEAGKDIGHEIKGQNDIPQGPHEANLMNFGVSSSCIQ